MLAYVVYGQNNATIYGIVKDKATKEPLPYVNVTLKNVGDGAFQMGAISNEKGAYTLKGLGQGEYLLSFSFVGYAPYDKKVFVGKLSSFLDLGVVELAESAELLKETLIEGRRATVMETMDKKIFSIEDNLSQSGSSVLQAMRNLPGVTVSQDGKVLLRGSDRVSILIDGKQTSLTGFGNQTNLDNIPASAIERIEVINNPSAKNDANGSAGIVNIIFKKNLEEGFNGKAELYTGLGALWIKRENYPSSRPQYRNNYKLNPSLSLNYRKKDLNWVFQGDLFSQRQLYGNEFIERTFKDGTFIRHQFLENRTQTLYTIKTGMDWQPNDRNVLTLSGLFNRESDIDRGDLPYFNRDFSERLRYWQHQENGELTGVNTTLVYEHKFTQPGHLFKTNLNFTFQREDEAFVFRNFLPKTEGNDATRIVADENVRDLNIDYVKPLKQGRFELGTKLRWRYIPTEMFFTPGKNSILDLGAQGWANYNEYIGAVYGNYLFESKRIELEAGLRVEAAQINYEVIPTHNTYKSGRYDYLQPFPNIRIAYVVNDRSRFSAFYNRRVDRPDEPDLRIFPKYDDPEILKTGNPNLRPQFTQSFELGYKNSWKSGYVYSAIYIRFVDNILTRILTTPPGSAIVNSISQNAGAGQNKGIELVLEQRATPWLSVNLNLNGYINTIGAFSIENVYPFSVPFSAEKQQSYSGNIKINSAFRLSDNWNVQLTGIYLAPDIIPQGRIESRYSIDMGIEKEIQKGKGAIFVNATDLFNTMRVKKVVYGAEFTLSSIDFAETQVIRAGYSYKF